MILGLTHGFSGAAATLIATAIAVSSVFLLRRKLRWPAKPSIAIWLPVTVMLLAAGILYALFPKESLLGERDEGIYLQHAMHLARTGSSTLDTRSLGIAESPSIQAIENGASDPLPGLYPSPGKWTFQFSSALPVWMAWLKATAGYNSALRFNAALGVLNCLAFFLLTRLLLPKNQRVWAFPALAVYAFNPVQIWISRSTLSEPLCTWFVLNGLLAFFIPIRNRRVKGTIAGVLVGMASFARIDGAVFLSALASAWAVIRLTGVPARVDHMLRWALIACIVMNLIALLYYAYFVHGYFIQLGSLLLLAWIWSAVAIGVGTAARHLSWPLRFSWPAFALPLAIAALWAYGMWVRPHIEPFSLIHSTLVPALNGTRDYREITVPNLVGYLTLPVVALAAIGMARFARLTLTHRFEAGKAFAMIVLLFVGAIFLWNPLVSPDQIWAARRWVPTVIPATIASAAIGISFLSARMPWKIIVASMATLLAAASLLWKQQDTLLFQEDAKLIPQIEAIAKFLPDDRPSYMVNLPTMASALLAGFGKPVVPIDVKHGRLTSAQLGLDDRCGTKTPCFVLHPVGITISIEGSKLIAQGHLTKQRRNTSPFSDVHGTHAESSQYFISSVFTHNSNNQ